MVLVLHSLAVIGRGQCNSYITQDVVFSTYTLGLREDDSSKPVDSLRATTPVRTGYSLTATNPAFTVISFTITVENDEGDILEAKCTGSWSGNAQRALIRAKPQTEIWFSCIKARHTNGHVYTLKPFSTMW